MRLRRLVVSSPRRHHHRTMSSRGYARLLGTAPSVLSSLSRPQLVNGSWNKPKLSGRKVAELRKLTIGKLRVVLVFVRARDVCPGSG